MVICVGVRVGSTGGVGGGGVGGWVGGLGRGVALEKRRWVSAHQNEDGWACKKMKSGVMGPALSEDGTWR